MAASKKMVVSGKSTALPAGFEAVGGGDGTRVDGQWVSPGEGVVVTGTLERTFSFQGRDGKTTAFEIHTDDGVKLLSERAAYGKVFAELEKGSEVYVRFDKLEKLLNKKTKKPTGQTFWRCTVGVKKSDIPF